MAKTKRRNRAAGTNGDSGFLVHPGSNTVVVRIPVKFYRRNGRQMVLAKDDASGTNQQATHSPNNALAAMLAKAWQWQELLESGEFSTLDELGRDQGVDRTYVSRVLKLTSLAPKIVESILSGKETEGLSVRILNKGIPNVWTDQIWL